MNVTIDKNSGYCFGVEFAIQMAEDELAHDETLYCLGDIVHNRMEVERLHEKGLRIIDREQLEQLHDCKVLIRAHGEPPETYQLALRNNIELIDASCPVVLKLQNRVKHAFDASQRQNGQIVIYGQPGHAEVAGLTGQTGNRAIIVMTEADLDQVDFSRPVTLFSQTTKSTAGFYHMKAVMEERIRAAGGSLESFDANDSICRQVSNREPALAKFAVLHDVIIFVSGRKSSNGKALFSVVNKTNPRSYFVENEQELLDEWFQDAESVGICGATSTPMWLMERVKDRIEEVAASVA
ncbi:MULTISPECIES: 4-hydroxy-3-methylbut-2-enyl diphosphate reductase [Hymenobacter]|uniref:4-hydroxy-3-methylbut-2-enyl diphosphate reductase n=1 Tax=Hymenobacter yonginensis TaxID=748197 RepID=A0ABY7PQU2_9BACT|nr:MULTISPECIES: 4-hydroxy-3-methylbut-2-enyl diphosphate reductase [Hymenobacter]AII51292.1 4-hydroxy-3-methylbut-2-enyl diphosphate reductase [Hymenobacter sp. APR13]WBO84803.1 4-hydroxy-3-methylbut-2-enyl diphosphate reductase [Hymenobacter yonginensis]